MLKIKFMWMNYGIMFIKNGYLLNGEANYLNKLKSVTTNFQDITIADLFYEFKCKKIYGKL